MDVLQRILIISGKFKDSLILWGKTNSAIQNKLRSRSICHEILTFGPGILSPDRITRDRSKSQDHSSKIAVLHRPDEGESTPLCINLPLRLPPPLAHSMLR